jgi:hypothetical protein
MAEERALAALETLLMSRTVGWVTPTEAEAVLREASPAVPFLGLKTVHTAKIAVGHTPTVSQQRSCGGLEQDVDRAEPASLDVPARALLPQHKAAPSHQTNDSAYEQPWLPNK